MPGFASLSIASALKVASLNLCTDEYLLLLAEPRQIVSVTYLAHQQRESILWRQARRHRANDGSLLSVAALKPDLLLTMGGGARDRAGIARRLGIRTLDLPYPQSLADIETGAMSVARAIGRPEARPWAQRMQALRRSRPARAADTIWLGGGGRSVASRGLAADWMQLAGFRQRTLRGDKVSLEQLLARPPAVLLRSDYRQGQYSGEQRWLRHPLAQGIGRSRTIRTDGRAWTCMGLPMIDEVIRLRNAQR